MTISWERSNKNETFNMKNAQKPLFDDRALEQLTGYNILHNAKTSIIELVANAWEEVVLFEIRKRCLFKSKRSKVMHGFLEETDLKYVER